MTNKSNQLIISFSPILGFQSEALPTINIVKIKITLGRLNTLPLTTLHKNQGYPYLLRALLPSAPPLPSHPKRESGPAQNMNIETATAGRDYLKQHQIVIKKSIENLQGFYLIVRSTTISLILKFILKSETMIV